MGFSERNIENLGGIMECPVMYLDCGGGYLGIYVSQNSLKCTLKWVHLKVLLYANCTLIKLIFL